MILTIIEYVAFAMTIVVVSYSATVLVIKLLKAWAIKRGDGK